MTVEEAWKQWANSESGVACLESHELLIHYDLGRQLNYRLRAGFVAGWNAKEEAAKEVVTETFDKMLGEEEP